MRSVRRSFTSLHSQTFPGRPLEHAAIVRMPQQPVDLPPQFAVAARFLREESIAIFGWKLDSLLEDLFDALPALEGHDPVPASSARSQALAVVHSRSTVRSESPVASAVSSADNPAKYRSSTILPC